MTPPVVDSAVIARLKDTVAVPTSDSAARGGLRNLLDIPAIVDLALSEPVRRLAECVLGPQCFAVRGILFDKTPDANWRVIWHQDLTIAVRTRCDAPGYGPWSDKEGVPHVQPPVHVLESMVAIRVHLDPCHADNGPVRVLSRSHRHGRLSASEIDQWKGQVAAVDCLAEPGGILAFNPLLLHASSPSRSPAHRRVVHIDFAATELTGGLEWAWRIR